MANERNALAELAVELERFVSENRGLFASRNHLILYKARRIVAELAAVKPNGVGWPNRIELADAYEKCRAIAERGAGDGK